MVIMTRNSIALCGFMAVGKTEVGCGLKFHFGEAYKYIEMDDLIVEKADKTIPEIFKEDGEIQFRELEMAVCKEVSKMDKVIVSCGGGVVLNKLNIDYLKQNCLIVLLEASVEEIYKRAMKDGPETRPVIDKVDPKAEIEKVLAFRKPFYAAAAELTIDTTGKMIEDIVHEIIDVLDKKK